MPKPPIDRITGHMVFRHISVKATSLIVQKEANHFGLDSYVTSIQLLLVVSLLALSTSLPCLKTVVALRVSFSHSPLAA